jgi:excinuclease UvrABC nuclease subunit
VLYVGRARDLRARLRSYFRSERQRPSVEAALLALDRIECRVLGSELEAALEELRLIRELQPPANSRSRPKERGFYLRPRGDDFVVTSKPTPLGPIPSRRQASLAARALTAGPLPRLRARLSLLAENLRYEEAARLRDRIEALERVQERLQRLDRLRNLEVCLVAPAIEPGWRKAFFVSGGRVCVVRSLPPGADPRLELEAALSLCRAARTEGDTPLTPGQAEDLLLIDSFVRRPPPEVNVLPLDPAQIAGFLRGTQLRRAA